MNLPEGFGYLYWISIVTYPGGWQFNFDLNNIFYSFQNYDIFNTSILMTKIDVCSQIFNKSKNQRF